MRARKLHILIFAVSLIVPLAARGQASSNDYLERVGRPDFGVLQPVEGGFINLANGQLHLEIPMGAVVQRGGRKLAISLAYDSNIYTQYPYGWIPTNVNSSEGGWRVLVNGDSDCPTRGYGPYNMYPACSGVNYGYSETGCNTGYGDDTIQYFTNFVWERADGTSKKFLISTSAAAGIGSCVPDLPNSAGYATDGSGFYMAVQNYTAATVYDNTGIQVYPTTLNTNGNVISSAGTTTVDELNRSPVIKTVNGNIVYYDILNSQGTRSRFTVTETNINVNTAFGVLYYSEYNGTIPVVQGLILPNGTSYAFGYDAGTTPGNYGLVTSVTLPSGAQIQYSYSTFFDSVAPATRWITSRNSAGNVWTYSLPSSSGEMRTVMVTNPRQESQAFVFDRLDDRTGSWNTSITHYDVAGNALQTDVKEYNPAIGTYPYYWFDGRLPARLTTQLPVSGGMLSKKTEYSYDNLNYGNVSEVREWDWYSGNPPSTPTRITNATYTATASSYVAANILAKPTSVVVKTGSGTIVAQTNLEYDNYTGGITASGAVQHNNSFGTSYTLRGNVTALQQWRNTDGAWLTTRNQYDDAGNVRSSIDPGGHTTTFSYVDSWSDTHCTPGGGNAAAYRTTVTNALNQSKHATYNSCTGTVASSTDANGQITTVSYDMMNRPIATVSPDGGETDVCFSEVAGTNCYNGGNPLKVVTTTKITSAMSKQSSTILDGLGRPIETLQVTPGGTVQADTTYDALGRVSTVSNPYFQGSNHSTDPTYGITTTQYDALSRVTQTNEQDGSIATISYSGNCTTATDEAGKKRKACSDALGRLINVWEDPLSLNYETDYQYDTLGNLLRVDQKGSAPGDGSQWRTRTFTYDSLSRLLSATNPESGATTYQYDNDGNLVTKTDARGIITNYNPPDSPIDAVHRVTKKTFSNGDSALSFTYDAYPGMSLGSSIGRLVRTGQVNYLGHYFSYDSMGRVTSTWQCLPSNCTTGASINAAYDLSGSLTSLTYPDGRVIDYAYDSAGRALSATDPASNTQYVWNATYWPSGAQYQQWAPTIYQRVDLNSRLQPTSFYSDNGQTSAFYQWKAYDYGTQNNGNLLTITNNKDSSRTQSFTYDALNRLASAQNAGTNCATTLPDGHSEYWGNSYVYDAWGNLLQKNVTKCSAETLNVTIANDGSGNKTNRLVGYSYDAAGNMLSDGAHTYSYDAQGMLKQVDYSAAAYTYDGDGNRLRKDVGSNWTEYASFAGNVLAEKTAAGWTNYIFFNGKRTARRDPSGAAHYYLSDHLGSTSMVVSAAGAIENESETYPWGGELQFSVTDAGNHYKFTGKEHDAESALDYFAARYLSSSLGRFISGDPLAGHSEDPQTLNRYTYVRNNPLTLTDPTGLDFHLACSERTDTCHNGQVGTTDSNGKFTPTVVTSDSIRNGDNSATVSENGVQITTGGQTYQGEYFDNFASHSTDANGKDVDHNPIDLQGSSKLNDFSFHVDGNCNGTCLSSGTWTYNGQSLNGSYLNAARKLLYDRGSFTIPFEDVRAGFGGGQHPGSTQHRLGGNGCNVISWCPNSPHLSVPFDPNFPPKANAPSSGEFHVDTHADWLHHAQDVTKQKP